MGSFLLQEWQAFLRYEDLPGAGPVRCRSCRFGRRRAPDLCSYCSSSAFSGASLLVRGCEAVVSAIDLNSLAIHSKNMPVLSRCCLMSFIWQCAIIGYSMGGAVAIPQQAALIWYPDWC